MNKANMTWSAKMYSKKITNGDVKFDNSIQRGLVWDISKKSLLIHSMIEGYPIPPLMSVRNADGVLDMLDGKQRSNAIHAYLNNEFKLSGVPEVKYTANGEEFEADINGMTYAELPEDIQDTVRDYSITIYYFQDITEEQINEMFFRLNNGKPLSAIELTRVRAKSTALIKEISQHEIFTKALSEKSLVNYANEDIVIKSWIMLNTDSPSFETKYIREQITTRDITNEQAMDITLAYNRIISAHDLIIGGDPDSKDFKKIAKKLFTKTHLLSILPFAVMNINTTKSADDFSEWLQSFFCADKTSISEVYNTACLSGSGKADSIRIRHTALKESYNKFFKVKNEVIEEEDSAFN